MVRRPNSPWTIHRELVHVGLAEYHQARGAQAGCDGGIVRRLPPGESLRAAGGRHVGRREHVLERNRHSSQGAECFPRGPPLVDRAGGSERAVSRDMQESAHVNIGLVDSVQMRLRQLDGRDLAPGHGSCHLGGGQRGQVAPGGHDSVLRQNARHLELSGLGSGRL